MAAFYSPRTSLSEGKPHMPPLDEPWWSWRCSTGGAGWPGEAGAHTVDSRSAAGVRALGRRWRASLVLDVSSSRG